MKSIEKQTDDILINYGLDEIFIHNKKIRSETVLYMVYWFNRLKNNIEEQQKITNNLMSYFDRVSVDGSFIFQKEIFDTLLDISQQYIKDEATAQPTIDLVIQRETNGSKEVLLMNRNKFPQGFVLPGGIVQDEYENNSLNVESKIYTALKIAAEKVLNLQPHDCIYEKLINDKSEEYFVVKNKTDTKKITIHPQDIYGYSIKENIKAVLRPLDPRHIVDTIGFKCELIDNDVSNKNYYWESKENLLNQDLEKKFNFAFNHHKEIILNILGKTSVELEMNFNENHFIKSIINNPLSSYQNLKNRFENGNGAYTSLPELFHTVNKILNHLFDDEINQMCEANPILLGFRDKTVNSLRHVSLKNRVFCPYLPTVHAIFDAISFFDIVTRHQKDFYNDLSSTSIIEHNPKEKENAIYHMYKYKYRMNELLNKIPDEIVIPTFVNLSATDLMKTRGVPIRFVGLSNKFIYVDEFEQSPEEFLMHDANHSYRMITEDEKFITNNHLDKNQFYIEHSQFISQYLNDIKLSENDNEKTKELKKIKKIILFEICHEDAKPFLPEIILNALIRKEGGETKFELPFIDKKTNYMDIIDILDTEISTLSYVRNKLQCGFYDKIDKQNHYIVHPKYRKAEYIAEAAFEMVYEMSILLKKPVTVDFDYLLKRTCSVGPNNIYTPTEHDETVKKYNDGAEYLNPKRYQIT